MATVAFYKKDDKLYVKCSKRKIRLLDIARLIVYSFCIATAYDIVFNPKLSFTMLSISFALPLFAVGLAGWIISIRDFILNGLVTIKRSESGYVIQNGGRPSHKIIHAIIQIQTLGKDSPGYLIAVGYADNDSFTLFRDLPTDDARSLTGFLSDETGIAVKLVGTAV